MTPALSSGVGTLRVDGGLTGSELLVQRLADLAGRPVDVASDAESTALGTALLAAMGAGWIDEADAAAVVGTKRRVEPRLDEPARQAERAAWRHFVRGASALVELRLISSDQSSNEE
jgi:glycerol kinase